MMNTPNESKGRWSGGRIAAAVLLTLVLLPLALVASVGVALGGCWHDCDDRRLGVQLLLAGGAGVAVLGVLVVGLLTLRSRTWWPFVGYCLGLVVLARIVEFAATRLEI